MSLVQGKATATAPKRKWRSTTHPTFPVDWGNPRAFDALAYPARDRRHVLVPHLPTRAQVGGRPHSQYVEWDNESFGFVGYVLGGPACLDAVRATFPRRILDSGVHYPCAFLHVCEPNGLISAYRRPWGC